MSGKSVKWGAGMGWVLIALIALGLMFVPLVASAARNNGGTMLAKRVCHRVCRTVRVPHTVLQKVCQWLNGTHVCRWVRRRFYRRETRCETSCNAIRG